MKRNFIILFALSIFSSPLLAQELKLEQDSLSVILGKAKLVHKPVFVVLSTPQTMTGYNETLKVVKGMRGSEYFNDKFLSYVTSFDKDDGAKLRERFETNIFPTFLYLDENGNALYRSQGMAPFNPNRFVEEADIALNKLTSGKTISVYQAQLEAGKATSEMLKEYIAERRKMGINDNHDIIEEYVKFQPVGSFSDPDQVLFVLEAGPIAFGNAYQIANLNRKAVETAYKNITPQRRVTINNQIIKNTMRAAIASKDVALATKGASFARTSWLPQDTRNAAKAFESNMLVYYKGIKDTSNYLRNLVRFTDNFYIYLSLDSANHVSTAATDSLLSRGRMMVVGPGADTSRLGLTKAAIENMPPEILARIRAMQQGQDSSKAKRVFFNSSVISPQGAMNPIASELNNNAWNVYLTNTTNNVYLSRALIWAKRAVDLNPQSAFYDTLAHIFYRLNFYEEALLAQQKAIKVAEQAGESTLSKSAELKKMKEKNL